MKFSQINYLTDTIMPQVKPNTFKVIMSIARATWGWKKECAQISFNDFQEATGIKGRTTLNDAIKDALDSGFVCRQADGNSFCYLMASTETVPSIEDIQYGNSTSHSTETVPDQYGNSTNNGTETVPNHSTAKENTEINKETITEGDADVSLTAVYSAYENNINLVHSRDLSQMIAAAHEEYGGQWVIDAIREAVRNSVLKWNYIEAILKNWKQNGRGNHVLARNNTVKQANDAAGGVYV